MSDVRQCVTCGKVCYTLCNLAARVQGNVSGVGQGNAKRECAIVMDGMMECDVKRWMDPVERCPIWRRPGEEGSIVKLEQQLQSMMSIRFCQKLGEGSIFSRQFYG